MKGKLSSKGQLTLPRYVREALGLKKGSVVSFHVSGRTVRLVADESAKPGELAGSLREYAKPRGGRSVRTRVQKEVARAAADEGRDR